LEGGRKRCSGRERVWREEGGDRVLLYWVEGVGEVQELREERRGSGLGTCKKSRSCEGEFDRFPPGWR